MSSRSAIAVLATLAVASTLPADALAQSVKVSEIKGASTATEIMALGATKLSAAQFREYVVDKTLDEGGWTWVISSDGTNSSAADDKSWTEGPSPWWMKGNQYCIETDGKDNCRDVYMIGTYLRFGQGEDLGGWTVKIK
jgi:hypothetical protein